MGYIYQADTYCDGCGERICSSLRGTHPALCPEDDMDTASYDSDDFPKPYEHKSEESDYGVLVSVMAPGFEFRSDRKSTEFRQWLEDVNASIEDLPDGAFKASGTSVSTKLVVLDMGVR